MLMLSKLKQYNLYLQSKHLKDNLKAIKYKFKNAIFTALYN